MPHPTISLYGLGFLGSLMLLANPVNAGAGANVWACVHYSQAPLAPIDVQFTAGGSEDHCMYNTGNDAGVSVTSAGLTCAYIGYIEAKASSTGGDTCATDRSTWTLSFVAGTVSGSTLSDWSVAGGNHLNLHDSTPGSTVCGTQVYCSETSIRWSDQGPLYFNFDPDKASTTSLLSAEDDVNPMPENVGHTTEPADPMPESVGNDAAYREL